MKNILLINHYAGSDKYGMEFRPFYMAKEWVAMGHRVRVVGASYSHLRRIQPKVASTAIKERRHGIEFFWLKTPRYQGNGLGRVFNILSFLWRLFWYGKYLTEDFKPDYVIASSTYPLDVLVARSIARRHGAKLVFEVHDLWPLSPVELGGYSPWNPAIVALQLVEDYAYRKADKVVSMLPCAQEYMASRGLKEEKYVHIPNGVDFSESFIPDPLPDRHKELIQELKEQDKFLLCYAGAMGMANRLDILLEACDLLKPYPVECLLIGQGPEEEKLKELAMRQTLFNVHFLPAIAKQQVPLFLAEMDALYIGLARQPLFRFGVSPNKLMDYMKAEKPIVYAIDSGNRPVDEAGCGLTVAAENPQAIADAVSRLQQMPREQRQAMGRAGGEYVKKHHDYSVLSRRFIESL